MATFWKTVSCGLSIMSVFLLGNLHSIVCSGNKEKLCPDGWMYWGGSCYLELSGYMTWFAAETACKNHGALIVVPESPEENSFLRGLEIYGIWMGCSDTEKEGQWVCLEGCGFMDWAGQNPDNWGGNQDCATMVGEWQNQWDDRHCDSSYSVVCKKPVDDTKSEPQCADHTYCFVMGEDGRPITDHCLSGYTLKEMKIATAGQCGQACIQEPCCRSFNVRQNATSHQKTCQLNYATRAQVNSDRFILTKNCMYFETPC
ncbi:asialoglycoprotein receptor 1-like [Patiria miniata]|uniref:C-type lectin n=1 Tax=Patiria miniata TaxID=46514 RepID=A0A914ALW4_PATMI|nr:asialoglycoprotein receptor 1-like [Patiria miniata]